MAALTTAGESNDVDGDGLSPLMQKLEESMLAVRPLAAKDHRSGRIGQRFAFGGHRFAKRFHG